jgi:hypothetical protein
MENLEQFSYQRRVLYHRQTRSMALSGPHPALSRSESEDKQGLYPKGLGVASMGNKQPPIDRAPGRDDETT